MCHIFLEKQRYLVAFGRCGLMVPALDEGFKFCYPFGLGQFSAEIVGHPVEEEVLKELEVTMTTQQGSEFVGGTKLAPVPERRVLMCGLDSAHVETLSCEDFSVVFGGCLGGLEFEGRFGRRSLGVPAISATAFRNHGGGVNESSGP